MKTIYIKCRTLGTMFFLFFLVQHTHVFAQTASTSDNLVAQPVSDRNVSYEYSGTGVATNVLWGLDTAWDWDRNVARGSFYMGSENVDVMRLSFTPSEPLYGGTDLTTPATTVNAKSQTEELDWRINLLETYANAGTVVTLNNDGDIYDQTWYEGYPQRWADLIDVTTAYVQAAGHTVVTAGPFNEPDYSTEQGTMQDFYDICELLDANPRFNTIRIGGGNTLNNDLAQTWYDFLKPSGITEGNTHQLAGGFDSFASFIQNVRADGNHATLDEMHNVMEAMVGAHYGVQTGIWWGPAELARGEFCKAARTGGVQLGYAEHRPNWTAASVYRNPAGDVKGFTGGSERDARTTSFRFVSKDQAVYYDGYGPQHDFFMEQPGGTAYWTNQPNAERVINITQGDDIQPVIDGTYVIVNRNSGKVLDIWAAGTTDNANAIQWTYTGASNQKWNVTRTSPTLGLDFSYYELTPQHATSMRLNNDGDVWWTNGANINQYTSNDAVAQHFYLEYVEDGWFYIRNRTNTQLLTVASSGTNDGDNILLWPEEAGNNYDKQWRFIPVADIVANQIEFTAPAVPSGLNATENANSVMLNWTASGSSDVKGYIILRSETAFGTYYTIGRGVTGTSFVDNTAEAGKTYYYKVRAIDECLNRSAYSNNVNTSPTGTNGLVAKYRFEDNTMDSTNNLYHGAAYSSGISYVSNNESDKVLALDGSSGFVQLPARVAHHTEITIAAWVYWNGSGAGNQQRIFDFGNGTDEYMYLTPNSGGAGNMRFAITNGSWQSEQGLDVPELASGVWRHVALTLGASGARLFVGGVLAGENPAVSLNAMDIQPVLNYIGQSQWPGDAYFDGMMNDFSIYNYALSDAEVAALAGYSGVFSGNIYTIESKHSAKVLTSDGSVNGSLLVQSTDLGLDNQQWYVEKNAEGYWGFAPRNASGKVLDVPGCNFSNGVQLNIWDSFGNDCQQFNIVDAGNGYFTISVKDETKYLDVYNWSTTDGGAISLWDYTGADNQLWKFTEVSGGIPTNTLAKTEQEVQVEAYPNPVGSHLFLDIQSFTGRVSVNIYTLEGKVAHSEMQYVEQAGILTIPRLNYKGMSLVKVVAGDACKTFKIEF